MKPQRHAVAVVGAGPVGFCTAIGLAQRGAPVVLLEADESVCFGSRAICISRRSLQILLERAQELADLIDIRRQTRLTGLHPRDDGVELIVRTPTGAYRMQTDWLVAADGGRSTVRAALDLKLQGSRYEGRYVIVDIRMKSARPTERLAYS